MSKSAAVIALLFTTLPSLAIASGGYGGSYGGGNSAPPRKVDQAYEYGKAIYKGRIKTIGKLNYCVVSGDEKVKIKSKTIKPYKGFSRNDLAKNLFNCDNPEELIFNKIGGENTAYVIYYLNKRYKLKLI